MSTSIEADPFRAMLPYYFPWKKKKKKNRKREVFVCFHGDKKEHWLEVG